MKKLKIWIGVIVLLVLLFVVCFMLFANPSKPVSLTDTVSATSISESASADKPESSSPDNDFSQGVKIKKYPENYASFKFMTPEGLTVIADPYMMNETVSPAIVTESHQHDDHKDVSKLEGNYTLIKETGSHNENGIQVTGYSGHHNKEDATETNIIFVYEINGIRIAHFASQGDLPSDETLTQIGDVDVLLIQTSIEPNYNHTKLSVDETKIIIDKLKPEIVIPEHGAENAGSAIASSLNLDVEFVESGEIIVTRSELDASKTLRVLDLDIDVPKTE